MAFDIARGMPLALFAWQAACGEREALHEGMAAADGPANQVKAYCDRFYFRFLLPLRRLTGRLSGQEYAGWQGWYASHRDQCVDGFLQSGDLKPGLIHAASGLATALLHPRSFLREYVLDS